MSERFLLYCDSSLLLALRLRLGLLLLARGFLGRLGLRRRTIAFRTPQPILDVRPIERNRLRHLLRVRRPGSTRQHDVRRQRV